MLTNIFMSFILPENPTTTMWGLTDTSELTANWGLNKGTLQNWKHPERRNADIPSLKEPPLMWSNWNSCRNANLYSHFQRPFDSFLNVQHAFIIRPQKSMLTYIPKRNKKLRSHKNIFTIICDLQKLKYCSVDESINILQYIPTTEYYSLIKSNEPLIHTTQHHG